MMTKKPFSKIARVCHTEWVFHDHYCWQQKSLMFGSWCWECSKSHALNSNLHSHTNSKSGQKNLFMSEQSKALQQKNNTENFPPKEGKKQKSNVTSEQRANIWQMKPKWILLAYFRQNKAGHFSSPPLSLLSTVCWVQALTAHSSTGKSYHMHHRTGAPYKYVHQSSLLS